MFETHVELIRNGAGRLADALLPPVCFSCGTEVEAHHEICSHCWLGLNFITDPYCQRCGFPFEHDEGEAPLCGACLRRQPNYDLARSVFRYDEASRRFILALKHGDRTEGIKTFAGWLARAGGKLIKDADLVVPVPLHPFRLFRRRYNQAGLLAKGLARELGCGFDSGSLVRKKATPSQAGLGRRERFKNVRSAFDVPTRRRRAISGLHVVLVDDVMTTGATVETCARVLKRARAGRVSVLTLARVAEPLPEPIWK